jgi:Putative adhesin
MGGAPPPQRTRRSGPTVVVAVIAVALIALGALSLISVVVQRTERSTRTFSGVDAIEAEVNSGDVEVTASSRGDVRVEQTVRRSLQGPRTQARLRGGLLLLSGRCLSFWFGNCSVNYRIQAPAGTRVRARSSSGDLAATGLERGVDLRTSSGDVQVRQVVGTVSAVTSSGDVSVLDAEGDVRATSSSGDVTGGDLVARSIEARTSSGDVDVRSG